MAFITDPQQEARIAVDQQKLCLAARDLQYVYYRWTPMNQRFLKHFRFNFPDKNWKISYCHL